MVVVVVVAVATASLLLLQICFSYLQLGRVLCVFLFFFFNQVYTCRSREAETCGRVIGDAESGAGEKRKNPGAETDYRLTHVQIMETSLLQFQFSLLALNLIYLKAVSQSRPYKVISQSLENPLAAGKSASAPPLAPPPPPLGSVTADTS